MGVARQLSWLASKQTRCKECSVAYVPVTKYTIALWEDWYRARGDWLTPMNWAIDRIYQENMLYCSPDCESAAYTRQVQFELDRIKHKHSGKFG